MNACLPPASSSNDYSNLAKHGTTPPRQTPSTQQCFSPIAVLLAPNRGCGNFPFGLSTLFLRLNDLKLSFRGRDSVKLSEIGEQTIPRVLFNGYPYIDASNAIFCSSCALFLSNKQTCCFPNANRPLERTYSINRLYRGRRE